MSYDIANSDAIIVMSEKVWCCVVLFAWWQNGLRIAISQLQTNGFCVSVFVVSSAELVPSAAEHVSNLPDSTQILLVASWTPLVQSSGGSDVGDGGSREKPVIWWEAEPFANGGKFRLRAFPFDAPFSCCVHESGKILLKAGDAQNHQFGIDLSQVPSGKRPLLSFRSWWAVSVQSKIANLEPRT